MDIVISTKQKRQVIDITNKISEMLKSESSGLVHIFVQHTTAAITTADLDPGTDQDLLDGLLGMLPDLKWRHPHNPAHAPDHLLSSIVGSDILIPVREGELQLGAWQRIILIEFDGPRERNITVSVIKSA